MSNQQRLYSFFQQHRTLVILVAVGLFLLEIEIFALAAMKSGRESRMQILGPKGNVIYETDGNELSRFNKYYFEKTFGPMEQYDVRMVTRNRPFPFRAWFVAAVGIPVGVVLLFGFVVRAWTTLFVGDMAKARQKDADAAPAPNSRFERVVGMISRFNIFVIGALVLLGVLAYWVVPNLLTYLGRVGIETLIRYKWVFLALAAIFLALVVWIVYLRYLLAKKAIESRMEVDKYRLRLESERMGHAAAQIPYAPKAIAGGPLTGDSSEPEDAKDEGGNTATPIGRGFG